MLQEGADERRVDVREVESRGRIASPLVGERDQQAKGVAIGADGESAGATFPD
jgi:hypothetical protein